MSSSGAEPATDKMTASGMPVAPQRVKKQSKMPRIAVGILFGLCFVLATSLYLAPIVLPPHTVEGLGANANMIDYADKWRDLPLFPRIVYWFGDLNCHQIASRSFTLNDNEMPVCARDVGIFTGNVLGVAPLLLIPISPFVTTTMLGVYPRAIREKAMSHTLSKWALLLGTAILFMLPMALDGTYQLVSQSSTLPDYESTNSVRFVTGLFFGLFGGYWVASMVGSLFQVLDER